MGANSEALRVDGTIEDVVNLLRQRNLLASNANHVECASVIYDALYNDVRATRFGVTAAHNHPGDAA